MSCLTGSVLKVLTKGVKVYVTGKKVKTDVALLVEYGYNIPAVSQKVQDKVKSAIENMTGLEVTDVNVRIAGVDVQSKSL